MIKYSPKESLRDEIDRFKSTNTFNPMEVTNFYVQAGIVLDYVEELEIKLQELIDRHRGTEGVVNSAMDLLRRRN